MAWVALGTSRDRVALALALVRVPRVAFGFLIQRPVCSAPQNSAVATVTHGGLGTVSQVVEFLFAVGRSGGLMPVAQFDPFERLDQPIMRAGGRITLTSFGTSSATDEIAISTSWTWS